MSISLCIVLSCLQLTAWAHRGSKGPKGAEILSPLELMKSVVKINNHSANIFSVNPQSGHGTGFFVGVDPNSGKGIIFTNRHVIEAEPLEAQTLRVAFNTEQKRAEVIEAQLVYVSRLHDFAVLEFDTKNLKRADLNFALPLPGAKSPFRDFLMSERHLRGAGVMAIGNPFDGRNVTTYGQITGLHYDEDKGPFIQTQTPINPGNSGGPLISLDTGEVVGMNTLTYSGADGTHFAIPIGILMDEYALWRSQKNAKLSHTIAEPRTLGVNFSSLDESHMKLLKLYSVIAKSVPGYWDNNSGALVVSDAPESSPLKNNDIVLTVNDEVVGAYYYDLRSKLQNAQGTVKFKVLRHGRTVTVDVPVRIDTFHSRREKLDFVYLSGLLIQEIPKRVTHIIRPDLADHMVAVAEVVDSPEVSFNPADFPPAWSILTSVTLGGKDYPVRRLLDLKKALKENPNEQAIIMRFYRSNWIQVGDGRAVQAASPRTGAPLIDGTASVFVLPLREVLTPGQFSINKFKKQFKFDSDQPATRDWREFMRVSCEEKLARVPQSKK